MVQLLRLMMGGSVLNVAQSRTMMNFSNSIVHLKTGTFLQSSKDKWATPVKGQGWKGFWIPFKDQVNKDQLKKDLSKKHTVADIGSGCDIVMFAIHGKLKSMEVGVIMNRSIINIKDKGQTRVKEGAYGFLAYTLMVFSQGGFFSCLI